MNKTEPIADSGGLLSHSPPSEYRAELAEWNLNADFEWFCLQAHHVEDRLLPLKQTVRHPLDPRTTLLVRTPKRRWTGASRAGASGLIGSFDLGALKTA